VQIEPWKASLVFKLWLTRSTPAALSRLACASFIRPSEQQIWIGNSCLMERTASAISSISRSSGLRPLMTMQYRCALEAAA